MTTDRKIRWRALVTLSVAGFLWSLAPELPSRTPQAAADDRFIVQGSNTATVAEAVAAAGGEVTHELTIIKAVGARLTPAQRRRLEKRSELRIRPDRTTSVSGMPAGDNMDDRAWQRAERKP
ncbi:MAG: hypothetical protein O3A25_04640 [Acidobacteria bacterium]|nr:hypothetical protein [Acidobacteriota bacterium]